MRSTDIPIFVLALVFSFGWARGYAAEGMRLPSELPAIATELKNAGLADDSIASGRLDVYPLNAVVSLDGCSGAFVSSDGLIVTNHHCGIFALQYNSVNGRDVLRSGFVAHHREEELPASPTQRVFIVESMDDVTDRITASVTSSMKGDERDKAIGQAKSLLEADCDADHRCTVEAFNGGASFRLIRKREIRDVRIVYAPPFSVGEFGGEVDNFRWPRHGGDFAFFRAYVAKDGHTAPYAPDNVPFKPKGWLKIERNGVKAGDFVMVAGFPGETNRMRLPEEFDNEIKWVAPQAIQAYERQVAIIDDAASARPDIATKYAIFTVIAKNEIVRSRALIGAARANDASNKFHAEDAELRAWLANPANLAAAKLPANTPSKIAALKSIEQKEIERQNQLFVLSKLHQWNFFTTAYRAVRLAYEREKPDADRAVSFHERDEAMIQNSEEQADSRYDLNVDKRLLVDSLISYLTLPRSQRIPSLDTWLGSASTPEALSLKVDALFAGSQILDVRKRVAWTHMSLQQMRSEQDAWLQLMISVVPDIARVEREADALKGEESADRDAYVAAKQAFSRASGAPTYPDANGTLRISYGNVQGENAADGVAYTPFTTLNGITAKSTGAEPFNVPQSELVAIQSKQYGRYASTELKSVPVDFLSDNDTTGGNSGSATLDAQGHLVGLVFDSVFEGIDSDWLYSGEKHRSVHVDVRFMLWYLHEVDHAESVLSELSFTQDR